MLQFQFNSFNLSVLQNHEQNLSGIYNVGHDLMLKSFRFQKSIISKNKYSTCNSKAKPCYNLSIKDSLVGLMKYKISL